MQMAFEKRKNICLTFIPLFLYIIGRKTPRCCTSCCTALHTFGAKRLKKNRKDIVLHVVHRVVLPCRELWKILNENKLRNIVIWNGIR